VYARIISLIPDATDTTKAFIRSAVLIESGQITPTLDASYTQALKKANVTINPKYGVMTPAADQPLHFALAPGQPNWILKSATPEPAPEQGATN
jgi:hypothetical protein